MIMTSLVLEGLVLMRSISHLQVTRVEDYGAFLTVSYGNKEFKAFLERDEAKVGEWAVGRSTQHNAAGRARSFHRVGNGTGVMLCYTFQR